MANLSEEVSIIVISSAFFLLVAIGIIVLVMVYQKKQSQYLQEKVALRSGFSTLTNRATFGLGFRARQLFADYAFGSTTLLGQSHHLSLSYIFQK